MIGEVEMTENLERKTVREWRLARDMTVEELAQAADMPVTTVYSAERGRHAPRYTTLMKLSKALGVGLDQFIWPEKFTGRARQHRRRGPRHDQQSEEGQQR